ncbi:MAG: MBL fold metallo-hydrolase [Ferruginibacter sp.]
MNRKDFLKTGILASGSLIMASKSADAKANNINKNNFNIMDSNTANICKTCGTRYAREVFDVNRCPICLDDRQYLKESGQQWISFDELKQTSSIKINQVSENIYSLIMQPTFAIGQRALFITSPEGNVLWDCLPFIDEASVTFIKNNGGLKYIAISHPHYYSFMNEWAKAFDCPVYLHQMDQNWVMDKSDRLQFWKQDQIQLLPSISIIHLGGHFPGSTVLHFKPVKGDSSLLTGDTLYLSRDNKHISVMYSYPNMIPISPEELFAILGKVGKLSFNSIYGPFIWQNIYTGADEIIKNSTAKYQSIYNKK